MSKYSPGRMLFLIVVFSSSITEVNNSPVKSRINFYDVYYEQTAKEGTKPGQYDCLYYDVVDNVFSTESNYIWANQLVTYCFRSENETSMPTFLDFHISIVEHQNYTFAQLKNNSVSSSQLLDWSAPIDLIENYQAYLDGESESSPKHAQIMTAQEYVFYNCTLPWFGPRCQYFFDLYPMTLEEYVFVVFSYILLYNPPLPSYYVHLTCTHRSTDLCLDWREVCDGREDCLNGEDEKECWKLETNECDENEYRCHNGQCIPLTFYMDDALNPDCMDRTDEPISLEYSDKCSEDLTFRCEETSCYPQMYTFQPFSCGDGQCVLPKVECENSRHNYIELDTTDFPWLGMEPQCFIVMSCLTGRSLTTTVCNCGQGFLQSCASLMRSICSPHLFFFPGTSVLLGHVYYVYNKTKVDRQNDLMTPMYICFNDKYCTMKNITQYQLLNNTCINYDHEFGIFFSKYPGWDAMNAFIEARLLIACASVKNECLHSSLYQCDHSSKCISTVRVRDGVKNCPLGDDERAINTCSFNESNKQRFQCPEQDWCWSPLTLNNGESDCQNGEDELHPNQRYIQKNIMFKFICDGIQNMLPINIHDENMTDETGCEQWPCNNSYTHCNSIWNCPKGEDELECQDAVIACPSLHHPCISPNTSELICLSTDKVVDGNMDCLGGSDERHLCREMFPQIPELRYHCWNKKDCGRKNTMFECDTVTDDQLSQNIPRIFSCHSSYLTPIQKHLCSLDDTPDYQNLELRLSNTEEIKSVENRNYDQISVKNTPPITIGNAKAQQYLCFRGLMIGTVAENGIIAKCICPPSVYGDHCQYQNQRVSLIVQVQSASDWRSMFTFIFILITDQNEIESYDHRYYSPSIDCAIKWNIYLLYRSRPKNLARNYSVRVDVYKRDSVILEHRASWYYALDFAFLPVHRLAVELTIPSHQTAIHENVCTLDCHGHGSCTVMNPNTKKKRSLCRCDPGWFGSQCQYSQVPAIKCSCAPGSLCISSSPTSICVCPLGRGGPKCYIKLDPCQNSGNCLNGGECIPDDERRHSFFGKKCLCPDDFGGEYCEIPITKLIISFHPTISIPFLTLVHLIQDKQLFTHQRVTTFKKILPYETSAMIRTTVNQFHLAFIEFDNHYYSINFYKDNTSEIRMYVSPDHRCRSVDELFNSTFAQLHLLRRIKSYQLPCRNHVDLSCFYDEVHICVCNADRYAVCILFEHNKTHICQGDSGNCENGGKCFQDDAKCPTMSACLCQDCFYGSKCQFSTNGFSLSLDSIIGYQIRPERNLHIQLFVIKFSAILVGIILIIGMINGLLSALVFLSKEAQKVGCGLYLLTTSLLSIVIMLMLTLKFIVLLLAQMTYITNLIFLRIQCLGIDYILRTCLNFSDWLNACVAIERASTLIQGVIFNTIKSKQIAKRLIFLLLILVAISNIHDPIYRRLITDTSEGRTWCIVSYPSFIQKYNTITQIIHFLTPFICNIISALIIIYKIAQQRSVIELRESFKKHIHRQLSHHKHLIISPIILVLLASPRLIISLISDCMKSNRDPWLLLAGYFISFAPSLLIFMVFILPSETYKKECQKLLINSYQKLCRRR